MIKFCYDRLAQYNIGYPNLAQIPATPFTDNWLKFDFIWPRTVPLRLLMYFDWLSIDYTVEETSTTTNQAWYPIGVGWFDHTVDYIKLIGAQSRRAIREHRVRILFHYHEGDDPADIKQRLDFLVAQHNMPENCYTVVSANSAAWRFENFIYFPDHELFFGCVNQTQPPGDVPTKRDYRFTCLSRIHKLWRLSCISDLVRNDLLKNSLWSYHLVEVDGEDLNPIECYVEEQWPAFQDWFLANAPYTCDTLNTDQQNNHAWVNTELYKNSYCNIVLETNYDNGTSQGAFLTEKTFKAIKFGQPFIIVGSPGSLYALREAGYRVFDNVIDNSYDMEFNNTKRWQMIKRNITVLSEITDMESWFLKCLPDIKHNQNLFQSRARIAVNSLMENLQWNQ